MLFNAAASCALRASFASAPHKDFSDLYGEMSGKGASASEAHPLFAVEAPNRGSADTDPRRQGPQWHR